MKKANIDKLDRIFSKYIRLRDADDNGYCRCISCGKVFHWKDGDAGHYINRKHMSVRWDEMNVHAQCRACNRFDEGNGPGYTQGLMKKYGPEVLDLLLYKKFQTSKLTDFEVECLIKHYNEKTKL
jgi:uncharacterized C2H2 Zn-finger protein